MPKIHYDLIFERDMKARLKFSSFLPFIELVIITDAVTSLAYIQVSIWNHFPSPWKTSFNISYHASTSAGDEFF